MKRVHVSPSQIHTWRACKRKWWYSRNRPRTSNKYAQFGTATHAHRERWLRDSIPPDLNTPEGRCAMAGLEHLPMPGEALVEQKALLTVRGVNYLGYIDLLEYKARAHVHDHKTCGRFDYALTADQLITDPQRIFYSAWAAVKTNADEVGATWHYLRRSPPECRPVSMTEKTPSLLRRMVVLHEQDGAPIHAAATSGAGAEAFPRSLDHCGAYGGCPHRDECLHGVSLIDQAAASFRRTPIPEKTAA